MTTPARDVADFRRRAFIRLIATTPLGVADPIAEWADREPLWEVFADRTELLDALQQHWVDQLSRRIHGEATYPLGPAPLMQLYADLSIELAPLRAILFTHQDDAAIAATLLEEHLLLARAAGYLDGRASTATLSWRARDLIATVPAQREGEPVSSSMSEA
jgi:hypothetical protein